MEQNFVSSTVDYHIMIPMSDKLGLCRMSAIVDMIIHTATVACEELGVSVDTMHRNNMAWVLSNLSVRMDKMPCFYDRIKIETWMEDKFHTLVSRNFAIYDSEGVLIGGASSYWAVIDMKKRCAIDFSNLDVIKHSTKKPSLIGRPERVKPKEGEKIAIRKVLYSDMDYNKHMYSVRYIDHIIDTIMVDSVEYNPFTSLDVCFHNEIVEGGEYSISVSKEKSGDIYSIYRSDGKPAAAVRLK